MKNMKKTCIESEIDKFLDKYEYTNIYFRYNKNKNKFDTEEITKSLKKLRNKLINISEFNDNKFNNLLLNLILNLWMILKNLNIINPKKFR